MDPVISGSPSSPDRGSSRDPAKYTRLYPKLDPWRPDPSLTTRESIESELFRIAEEWYERAPSENDRIPSGYTYLGQFLNHDIHFGNLSTSLDDIRSPAPYFRVPSLNLDCVYGRGPGAEPDLYLQDDPRKFRIGENETGDLDLPRGTDASGDRHYATAYERMRPALIPNPLNDQHILISQLHLAFLRFHNRRIDEGLDFEAARRSTRWHYQWVVVYDFLAKRLCGEKVVDECLRLHLQPQPRQGLTAPSVPLEFSLGAFRVGHGMVRPAYHLNDKLERARGGAPIQLFLDFGLRNSLLGGRQLPPGWTVQWDRFVEFNGSKPQPSMRIGSAIARPLRWLPRDDTNLRRRSLSFRTLLTGYDLELPSGQAVAKELDLAPTGKNDPLWLYVLRESIEHEDGLKLGPVGARIVSEVIVSLLAADPTSFVHHPEWRPDVVADFSTRGFSFCDFLEHAGAPMTAVP